MYRVCRVQYRMMLLKMVGVSEQQVQVRCKEIKQQFHFFGFYMDKWINKTTDIVENVGFQTKELNK